MKNSGSCPKCGGSDILRIPVRYATQSSNAIPAGWLNSRLVWLTRFVCADCGFSEEWVENQDALETLRTTYENAQPEAEVEEDDTTDALPLLICEICGNTLVVEEGSFVCPRCSQFSVE